MSRAERVAHLRRELAEMRSRLLRIQGEADSGIRDLAELQTEVALLEAEEVQP